MSYEQFAIRSYKEIIIITIVCPVKISADSGRPERSFPHLKDYNFKVHFAISRVYYNLLVITFTIPLRMVPGTFSNFFLNHYCSIVVTKFHQLGVTYKNSFQIFSLLRFPPAKSRVNCFPIST